MSALTRGFFLFFEDRLAKYHTNPRKKKFRFLSCLVCNPSIWSHTDYCCLVYSVEMVPLVSVAGYISLLEEPEPELQAQALINLNELVDQFWMEIAEYGSTMYFKHMSL